MNAMRAAVIAVLLLVSTPALAASRLLGPVIGRATELAVESQHLSLVYEDGARDRIRFEARYTVVNASSVGEELGVAFYYADVDDFRLTVDGAAPQGEPTGSELGAIERSVTRPSSSLLEALWRAFVGPDKHRVAFRIAAEPGTRHEIVISGRAYAYVEHHDRFLELDAVAARHLLVGTQKRPIDNYVFEYDLVPRGDWRSVARMDLSIAYPSRWPRPSAGKGVDLTAHRDGATRVLTGSMSAERARDLRVAVDAGFSSFRNGGPLIALGGTLGSKGAVRGRIGYEVAAPGWLLYSLTADTDFRRRFIVTPLIEAASPTVFIIPSFGIGAGVPVQIAPERRVGVRVQGDIHLLPLGVVMSVDIYPPLGSLKTMAEMSILGQVGF